jgi:hypothetical protein
MRHRLELLMIAIVLLLASVLAWPSEPAAQTQQGTPVNVAQVNGLTPKAEDVAHATGDTGIASFGVRKDGAAQTTDTDGDYANVAIDAYSALFARRDHPNRIRCTVTVSTATTITAVGGSCAAPGATLSIYVTDILFATNAAGIAADSFNTLKYGTGGTCGTGTTVFWGAMTTAATQATAIQSFATPIKIPANNELCWINTTAGSKFLVITGFIAP